MEVIDWGLIDYKEALDKQIDLVNRVADQDHEECLVFCSHPKVLTIGRATEEGDIESWDGPIYEIQRGGRVTFHGPGQIVVYPILDLNRRNRDLHKVLRTLEKSVMETLSSFGLDAEKKEDETGVWLKGKKVASIGIAAKRWVTYHGLALNYKNEFSEQGKFKPCGFQQAEMAGVSDF
ncbi:MAG: lipoyl(octanoyl) transferase LipB, partial [Bdellovibrionales bacterium]|nr:lipoyl(octanoyl) transferase LipB [Bdellovibrionales bacterium]